MAESGGQRTLVFGDDGTGPSDLAWEWVNAHDWPGWSVDVLTARVDDASIDWGRPARVESWQPGWARPTSQRLGQARVRFLLVATDPRAMLADRSDADLMVVGIRPRRPLEGMWMGSTTEWLLHHPPAPLAVIKDPKPTRRVIVCSDGSEHSLAACSAFARLPQAGEAQIEILVVDDGRVDVASSLEKTAAVLAEHGIEAEPATAEGRPTTAIMERLHSVSPDLAVFGTRGLTGWKRLRLGSTAAAVVRAAPVSCLVSAVDVGEHPPGGPQ